jgi:hypothetical protein
MTNATPELGIRTDVHLIASARTLDGFGFHIRNTDGVDVRVLVEGTTIVVRTRHSRYHLVVVEPETGRVRISGGDRFLEPTEAMVVGATGGGSMLKPEWIGVGLRLELLHLRERTTTSVVNAITIERPPHDAV